MDPLSITATCFSLISTITSASFIVIGFVKDVRAARSDLDVVSRELISLRTILELLADDVNDSSNKAIPQTLQKQIVGIITNCSGVVVEIEKTLKKHEGGKLSKATRWVASGKADVAKLQLSLEAHKSALEIGLDMVSLTLTKEIKADTQEILNDTSTIKQDTTQILAEIARLQEQLPRDANRHHTSEFMLERYLDNLTNYAETVCDTFPDGIDDSKSSERGSVEWERSNNPITLPGIKIERVKVTEERSNNLITLPGIKIERVKITEESSDNPITLPGIRIERVKIAEENHAPR